MTFVRSLLLLVAITVVILVPIGVLAGAQEPPPATPPTAPPSSPATPPPDASPAEQPTVEEDVTVVATTRTGRRLEDEPTRVEVLEREEIEEKMLMTPGDIVMLLNEMGGLRVQTTSPSTGAATVRVQGMRGRYTRFLSDGLPLAGQVGGLGLLQIPPMDLGRVEVIKGIASALYGSSAMGGVVNVLARRPGPDPEREVLINRSGLGGTDGVIYLSTPTPGQWSASFLGSAHWQDRRDRDDDGWADVAGYTRGVVRPRVFWDDGQGRSAFLTAGATTEARRGGTMPDASLVATGNAFEESVETKRIDVGGSGQTLLGGRYVATVRGALVWQRHEAGRGSDRELDRRHTAFGEMALRGAAGRHTWVAGVALERDAYRALDVPRDQPDFSYTHTVPGLFAQNDVALGQHVSILASGRMDWHSVYGAFFSPRVSALVRGGGWTSRLSIGEGFSAPTPINEDTEAASLRRLVVPRPLEAEEGLGASLDVTRTSGPGTYTVTAFASRVRSPLRVEREARYALVTADGPSSNVGVELLATIRREPVSLTATYTLVRSREQADGVSRDAPLTPRHSAGLVGMIESEDKGRIGVEVYYTGRQALEVNPFATVSRPYVIVGALVERRFGRLRLFLNAENLTDARQTRWQPLIRPDGPLADGRWTVDAWAPLDGRVFNGGVRMAF